MAKVYQCDSCKETNINPYELQMKEFLYVCEYMEYGVFPRKAKTKTKIHLCHKCFMGLVKIGEAKLKEIEDE